MTPNFSPESSWVRGGAKTENIGAKKIECSREGQIRKKMS